MDLLLNLAAGPRVAQARHAGYCSVGYAAVWLLSSPSLGLAPAVFAPSAARHELANRAVAATQAACMCGGAAHAWLVGGLQEAAPSAFLGVRAIDGLAGGGLGWLIDAMVRRQPPPPPAPPDKKRTTTARALALARRIEPGVRRNEGNGRQPPHVRDRFLALRGVAPPLTSGVTR